MNPDNRRKHLLAHISRVVCAHARSPFSLSFVILITMHASTVAQAPTYPDKIRGYKVERTVVEVKKSGSTNRAGPANNSDEDSLIRLGEPQLARATPLGITFEVPIIVAPITQSGHVSFLVFEDMVVNGTSVEIDEY